MIQSLNREEEMRQRLRKESMINNRSQLENQIMMNKARAAVEMNKSFSSSINQPTTVDKMNSTNTFEG